VSKQDRIDPRLYLESLRDELDELERFKRMAIEAGLDSLQTPPYRLANIPRRLIIQCITQIAEAAKNLPLEWLDADMQQSVKALGNLRNILVHGYLRTADDRVMWNSVTDSAFEKFRAAVMLLCDQHL